MRVEPDRSHLYRELEEEIFRLRRSIQAKDVHIATLERQIARTRLLPGYWLWRLVRGLIHRIRPPDPPSVPLRLEPRRPGLPPALVEDLPTNLFIEVTNHCNLRCIMCSRQSNEHPPGRMSRAVFQALEPILPGCREVHLHGCGESMIHPRFLEMLRRTKRAGPRVDFNSNFTLVNEEMARELVRLEIDQVVVSLDGATRETYEGIRRGARFDRVVENLTRLRRIKAESRSELPRLGVEFVAMRRNVVELPELIRLMPDLGLEWIQVAHLRVFDPDLQEESLLHHPDLMERCFADARRAAAETGLPLELPPGEIGRSIEEVETGPVPASSVAGEIRTCWEPWRTAYVQWNGDVFPCCYWARSMGNLTEHSFREIWEGEEYRRIRAALFMGDPPEACRSCTLCETVADPGPRS